MMYSKRKTRRQRHSFKTRLRELDAIAEEKIRENMLWSIATWGGSKCPGCGIAVRPYWLMEKNYCGPLTIDGRVVGNIDAFGTVCEFVKTCPGERDWE